MPHPVHTYTLENVTFWIWSSFPISPAIHQCHFLDLNLYCLHPPTLPGASPNFLGLGGTGVQVRIFGCKGKIQIQIQQVTFSESDNLW